MKYPNIDAERARMGLTLDGLAKALGISRKTLYNWCNHGKNSTRWIRTNVITIWRMFY